MGKKKTQETKIKKLLTVWKHGEKEKITKTKQ